MLVVETRVSLRQIQSCSGGAWFVQGLVRSFAMGGGRSPFGYGACPGIFFFENEVLLWRLLGFLLFCLKS